MAGLPRSICTGVSPPRDICWLHAGQALALSVGRNALQRTKDVQKSIKSACKRLCICAISY